MWVSENFAFNHQIDEPSGKEYLFYRHMHPYFEIFYFLQGKATFTIDSVKKHLEPGDIVLVQPGKYHFATVEKSKYERCVTTFSPSTLPSPLQKKIADIGPFFVSDPPLKHLFNELEDIPSLVADPDLQAILGWCRIEEILIRLVVGSNASAPEACNALTRSVLAYLDSHISEPINIGRMSEELHYSKSHISNAFTQSMNCSLMRYVRSKKIMAAHALIQSGVEPKKAAEECGFEDYSTFYRSYCKIIGHSPSQTEEGFFGKEEH